jgi:hypothetical protein
MKRIAHLALGLGTERSGVSLTGFNSTVDNLKTGP